MNFIDTHTHLYLPEFDDDRDEAVSRAVERGVGYLLLPNIDSGSIGPMLESCSKYPGICYPMLGIHPTSVKADWNLQLGILDEWIGREPFVAIGEIGIDLYWDKTYLEEQVAAFRYQLEFALDKGLPAVIHCRDSFPEVFRVLDEFRGSGLKGVFHAFSGTAEQAERAIEAGFMIGIGGIVTFRNAGLDMVVKKLGAGMLVLETDSPYLAPAPNRGKRNESSYIPLIAARIAEITGNTIGDIAEITSRNAESLFNLKS